MTWFFIALISPALWAVSNYFDKYFIEKYFKGRGGIGALILFSSLIGLFIPPLILIFKQDIFNVSYLQIGIVWIGSLTWLMATLIYFYALRKDEASVVVPLFQIIPIFAFILGYLFLDEVLAFRQIVGALLVILGGFALSLDLTEKMPRFKSSIFFLMLASSFLMAIGSLTFKFVAIEAGYWTTNFWGFIGQALIGIAIFSFIRNYRVEFLQILKENKMAIIALSGINEIIAVVAGLAFTFAVLLAPLALVQTVNGFQPFFVFLYGLILTLFFPDIVTESLSRKHLLQKIITIAVMLLGTYILNT